MSNLLLNNTVQAQTDPTATCWYLDRLDSIGGNVTSKLPDQASTVGPASELPSIIQTEYGTSSYFNGINNGFLVKANPLGTATVWTLELIFKPDSSSNPNNLEQRILHIAQNASSSARLLLELRLVHRTQQWAFDLYMSNGSSSLIILDTVHAEHMDPAGRWYHVALVYTNQTATFYVNGIKDSSGSIAFSPLTGAQSSIGARQNPKSWFKGAIRVIKSTPRVLAPSEFLQLSATTKVAQSKPLPTRYLLDQNFPNPFNPSTTIQYQLPTMSHVSLKVYDILGREMVTLIDGMEEAGYHQVQFNGSKLSSGVYITCLASQPREGTAFLQTMRMILVK